MELHVYDTIMDSTNCSTLTSASHSHLGEALKSMAFLALRLSSYDRDERGRPVPAPRPSRYGVTDKHLTVPTSQQARSCSVPPNTRHMWLHVGRELNVDDGLSVRSESTHSLVSLCIIIRNYKFICYVLESALNNKLLSYIKFLVKVTLCFQCDTFYLIFFVVADVFFLDRIPSLPLLFYMPVVGGYSIHDSQ